MSIKTMTRRVQTESASIETLQAAKDKAVADIAQIDTQLDSAGPGEVEKLADKRYQLQHRLTGYSQALEAAQRRKEAAASELDQANKLQAKADATKRSKGYVKRLEAAVVQIDSILAEFKDIQNEAAANLQANHKWGYELQYPDRNYHQINSFMGDKLREVKRYLGDFVKGISHD